MPHKGTAIPAQGIAQGAGNMPVPGDLCLSSQRLLKAFPYDSEKQASLFVMM